MAAIHFHGRVAYRAEREGAVSAMVLLDDLLLNSSQLGARAAAGQKRVDAQQRNALQFLLP